jgi:hypothetical protein
MDGKYEVTEKGSYGVTHTGERDVDGTKKFTGMSMTCPVNVCSDCERVVAELYPDKRHGKVVGICFRCKERNSK